LTIDAHGLKILGSGEFKVSPKSLGVKAFSTKLPGDPDFGFYCFFNKFFDNFPGRGAVAVKLID